MEPLDIRLNLNTHLQPTKFMRGFGGTRDQVPLCISAVNSWFIAVRQLANFVVWEKQVGYFASVPASVTKAWVGPRTMKSSNCFVCLVMLFFVRVNMAWVLGTLGSGHELVVGVTTLFLVWHVVEEFGLELFEGSWLTTWHVVVVWSQFGGEAAYGFATWEKTLMLFGRFTHLDTGPCISKESGVKAKANRSSSKVTLCAT